MAPQTEAADDNELLAQVSAPAGMDADNDLLRKFVSEALDDIRDVLESNREEAMRMTDRFDEDSDTVDDVLSPDNVRDIEVRARPFENPHIKVWLRDCPIWANEAGNEHCYPRGLNAYNGKTHYVYDVRPF